MLYMRTQKEGEKDNYRQSIRCSDCTLHDNPSIFVVVIQAGLDNMILMLFARAGRVHSWDFCLVRAREIA